MKHAIEQYRRLLEASSGLLSAGDTKRVAAHVDDALTALPALRELAPDNLMDIGSGGGLPGIPLALALPSLAVTLVESQSSKAHFLETCRVSLNLEPRLTVVCERSEQYGHGPARESADVVTVRAVAAPAAALELAAPFVRTGGHVLLWITRDQDRPRPMAAAHALGVTHVATFEAPSALRDHGIIAIYRRQDPLPARFPRRTGVAVRRPLA